jgi:putative flippase GtrA
MAATLDMDTAADRPLRIPRLRCRVRHSRSGAGLQARHSGVARWVRFNLVGVLGFAVQTAALWLLITWAGLHTNVAVAIAVLAAVSHNFLWHERWTWPGLPPRARLARWLSFHASTGLVSLAGNLIVTAVIMRTTRLPAVAANMVAVALLSLVNYWLSDRVVFR